MNNDRTPYSKYRAQERGDIWYRRVATTLIFIAFGVGLYSANSMVHTPLIAHADERACQPK